MDMSFLLPLSVMMLAWIVLGVFFALAWPGIRIRIHSLAPRNRFLFIFMYGMLPPGMAATVAVLVFTPLIGGMNLSGHCHALTCTAHVPVLHAGPLDGALLSGFLMFAILAMLLLPAIALWKNWRLTSMLTRLSDKNTGPDYYLIETREPVACCAGLFSPAVVISRGLQQRLTPPQLNIVISHERAHAYRYDNLYKMLVAWGTAGWPTARRQQILEDIELACEQACDERVAEAISNRSQVAELIMTVATWQKEASSVHWKDRVNSLMQSAANDTTHGWKIAMAVVTGSAALLLVASDVLHQVVEAWLTVVPVY